MHKIWSLSSNGVTREFHPIAQVYVSAGTMGQFSTNCLAENGRRIPILGQIPINGSVKFLGIFNFHRTSGPIFIENIRAPHDTPGWVHGGNSNQNWPVIPGDLTTTSPSCGMVPSLAVLLTFPGVRRTCALLHTVSVMTLSVVGVVRA